MIPYEEILKSKVRLAQSTGLDVNFEEIITAIKPADVDEGAIRAIKFFTKEGAA